MCRRSYGRTVRWNPVFVFFDIGDTLVDESDFARLRHASVLQFFAERGYPMTEEQYTTGLNNLSMQSRMTLFEQLRWLARNVGGDTLLAMAIFRDYILHVASLAPETFKPFPDARATLRRLARPVSNGTERHRLGIIANQPTWIRARMHEWNLLEFFESECVVISDEVAVSKPSPEIFQFALDQAAVKPGDAVMLGNDYVNDIEPAKRLGMHTVWVEREDPYVPGAPSIHNPWAADERVKQLAQVPIALARLAAQPRTNDRQTTTTVPRSARRSSGRRPPAL